MSFGQKDARFPDCVIQLSENVGHFHGITMNGTCMSSDLSHMVIAS